MSSSHQAVLPEPEVQAGVASPSLTGPRGETVLPYCDATTEDRLCAYQALLLFTGMNKDRRYFLKKPDPREFPDWYSIYGNVMLKQYP